MALNKLTLQNTIYEGLYSIFIEQSKNATDGKETEDPEAIIKKVSNKMASVLSDAIEKYVKSGDVSVGQENVLVTSSAPGTPATVTPLKPAKIV